MKLAITLPTDISIALRRAANEMQTDREEAAVAILRDALTALGHLEPVHLLDEDSETSGSA